jgi:trimeric autotransporter adhesin
MPPTRATDRDRRPLLGLLGLTLPLACAALASAATGGARLASITLEPATEKISLIPGERQAIRAIATYTDRTTADVTDELIYSSSKPAVVAIVGPALAEARASGDAEVWALDPLTGKSSRNKVKFKIAKLKAIEILPVDKVVRVGRGRALRAVGRYDNGRSGIDLTRAVIWTSDKQRIATVGNDEDAGWLTGVAAGSAKIRAEEPFDRVKSSSDSGRVTVVAALSSIAIEPSSVALRKGESLYLSARGVCEREATLDLSDEVEWTSSDADVVAVETGGLAAAVGVGRATVTARDPTTGIESRATQTDAQITVIGGLVGIVVEPARVSLPVGGTTQFSALALFEGDDEPLELVGVRWRASNTSVLSIDGTTGAARCVAAGTAAVSASDGQSGESSTSFGGDAIVACVVDRTVLRIDPAKALLELGKTKAIKASLVRPDGTERDVTSGVTWTSSRPDVVDVVRLADGSLRAKAWKAGTAVLGAREPTTGTSSGDPGGTPSKLSVPGPPKALKIFPKPDSGTKLELTVGSPLLLKARVDFEGGATQGANAIVAWESSDPSILRVSTGEDGATPGTATPLRQGDVTVTIRYPKPGAPPPKFPPANPMSASVAVRVRRAP